MAQQDDACTLLDEDHNQAVRLFTQYKSAGHAAQKRLLAQQLCHELAVHMQIEEEIFYPAFQRATQDDGLLQESTHEHREARELIAQIQEQQVADKLMLELEDTVLHHVNDEREKMFPQARKAKGLDLMALSGQLQARKAELMAGHPA